MKGNLPNVTFVPPFVEGRSGLPQVDCPAENNSDGIRVQSDEADESGDNRRRNLIPSVIPVSFHLKKNPR
jgi:hypothetical protein